jgi:hypothetical protein
MRSPPGRPGACPRRRCGLEATFGSAGRGPRSRTPLLLVLFVLRFRTEDSADSCGGPPRRVPLVGIAGNVQTLLERRRSDRASQSEHRRLILTLPRVPVAREVPRSTRREQQFAKPPIEVCRNARAPLELQLADHQAIGTHGAVRVVYTTSGGVRSRPVTVQGRRARGHRGRRSTPGFATHGAHTPAQARSCSYVPPATHGMRRRPPLRRKRQKVSAAERYVEDASWPRSFPALVKTLGGERHCRRRGRRTA